MKSTGIAAIFLDKAYRIRRYTSPFSDYINILPVDVNRSFLDLKLPFAFDSLEHHLEQCALTGEVHSRRVHLPDERVALFKIVPYLNSYRQIDGVVLMIDEVKELTTAMRDIEIIRYESDQLYLMMYLDDETKAWAQALEPVASDEDAVVHLDSNGAVLATGDTVTLIKDLDVKGTSFVAKRGTAVRGIALVDSNPEHIEGRVNGTRIVILTKFVKKAV